MQDVLLASLVLISVISIAVGIGLIYFNAEVAKRKRAVKLLSIVSGFIVLFGIFSKIMYYPGASIEIIVGLFFFALAVLPLVIKARYEARKTLLKGKKTRFLNITDFIAFAFVIFGILFRFLHWPGAMYLLIIGGAGVVFSMITWNRSFRNEVKLRAETELKLQEAFAKLESQHHQITEKNKEILDSINYAERIQKTILPGHKLLQDELRDYFIWYQPRDIVSGDFYWATKSEGRFFLAIADSTGHGVPGAFMSLLNSNFLNEAIVEKKISETGAILDYVRNRLIASLSEDGSEDGGQDGMDCVLMKIDRTSQSLSFSGANNGLVLFRNGELLEFEGDRMPVGRSIKTEKFTGTNIQLQAGDVIYAFSDGYGDQFGGPSGKKFKRKQLLSILASINTLPMPEQKEILKNKFRDWKGELEQLDDILIAGIRF